MKELSLLTQAREARAFDVAMLNHSKMYQLYQFFNPNALTLWRFKESVGEVLNIQLYDPTGCVARESFSSLCQSSLTPMDEIWAQIKLGPPIKDANETTDSEAVALGQAITKIVFDYINRSSFAITQQSVYDDLGVLGTGVLQVNEGHSDKDPLNFQYVPLGSVALENDKDGRARSVWRVWQEIPGYQIMSMWPDGEYDEQLKAQFKDSERKFDLVEATILNEDHETYTHYVKIKGHNRAFLFDDSLKSSPFIIFRWKNNPLNPFGWGPGTEALCTMQTLNEMYRLGITAAQFMVTPTFIGASDGIFNPWNVSIEPGTIMPVSSVQASPLEPLHSGSEPQFATFTIQDLRQLVNDIFFTQPLGPIDKEPRTATEINIRQKMFAEKVGPSFGRLIKEGFTDLIQRILYVLKSKGLASDLQLDSQSARLEMQPPIMDTLGRDEVNKVVQTVEILTQMLGPQAAEAALKVTQVPMFLAKNLNADIGLFNVPEDVQRLVENFGAAQLQGLRPQTQTPALGSVAAPPLEQ